MARAKVRSILLLPRQILCGLIRAYQRTLSPDHGWWKANHPVGYCRFQPTCSEYGYQAIQKHGVFKGGMLASWRIMRCHPFAQGGPDPVP